MLGEVGGSGGNRCATCSPSVPQPSVIRAGVVGALGVARLDRGAAARSLARSAARCGRPARAGIPTRCSTPVFSCRSPRSPQSFSAVSAAAAPSSRAIRFRAARGDDRRLDRVRSCDGARAVAAVSRAAAACGPCKCSCRARDGTTARSGAACLARRPARTRRRGAADRSRRLVRGLAGAVRANVGCCRSRR